LAKKAKAQDTVKSELADKAEPQKAEPQGASKTELAKTDSLKGPLQIIISIADQRISLYDNGALIGRSSISTGVQGYPTPLGHIHRSQQRTMAPLKYL
jgi:hypothetical protein